MAQSALAESQAGPCPLRPLERASQSQHEEVQNEEEDPVAGQEHDVMTVTLSHVAATMLGLSLLGRRRG